MFAPPVPAASDPLLPAYVRADGGVRLRFGRVGARTHRLELAESGGYRARFPTTFDASCEAVLINTGGGMAGGDAMRVAAVLEAGSDVVITSQAAEKIYRSQGADTCIETALTLKAGASLAWLPQESILFSGARLARNLTIDLAADARLVACESVFSAAAPWARRCCVARCAIAGASGATASWSSPMICGSKGLWRRALRARRSPLVRAPPPRW